MLRERILHRRFRARGPWQTLFRIDGEGYGGWRDYTGDNRLSDFADRFPPCRVLELGCLEGGHTVELARRGYTVTAVEGRADNAARARWVLGLLDADAEVIHANLEVVPLLDFGHFDVVYCAGLLYHLPKPWLLIQQCAEVAPALFVSTHVAETEEVIVEDRPGRWYQEYGLEDRLSGMSSRSFWFTTEALLAELRSVYERVEVVREDEIDAGPLVSAAAWTGVAATRGL